MFLISFQVWVSKYLVWKREGYMIQRGTVYSYDIIQRQGIMFLNDLSGRKKVLIHESFLRNIKLEKSKIVLDLIGINVQFPKAGDEIYFELRRSNRYGYYAIYWAPKSMCDDTLIKYLSRLK